MLSSGVAKPLSDLARRAGRRRATRLGPGPRRHGKDAAGHAVRVERARELPGGVWFCDLSEARSLDGIVSRSRAGTRRAAGRGRSVIQLGHAIAGRGKCLVILDNFEQVARHAEETLGRWLNRAGDARFLVTTREVLGLPGEEIIGAAAAGAVRCSESVSAQGGGGETGIPPSAEDQSAIAPLVTAAGGLPLAIELGGGARERDASADAAPSV